MAMERLPGDLPPDGQPSPPLGGLRVIGRALAAQRGLDANQWFGSVERVARANGVLETVAYVSNIAKYATQFRGRVVR